MNGEKALEQVPSVARIVHYMSYGTPGGEYPATCRAAIVTQVAPNNPELVGLAVLNPSGVFFNVAVPYSAAEQPGSTDCPNSEQHGSPFRYCPCGWREAFYPSGTWHWPERV